MEKNKTEKTEGEIVENRNSYNGLNSLFQIIKVLIFRADARSKALILH